EIGFSLGVDSINNHTGSQPAALNPTIAGDMFWTWAFSYKFLELEGYYGPGYSSTMLFYISEDNNYKKWLMNSTTLNWANINIKDNASTTVILKANIDEMFKTPVTINFATTHNVSGGTDAQTIANNYADMFGLSAIVNP
ncbi:MAG TPA: MbnP family protein, partial [Cytophagaceae bacterium]|nr:MbnP family protein [Cytophagaceae bacterium]